MKSFLIILLSLSLNISAIGQAFSWWNERDFSPYNSYRLPLKFDLKKTWLLSHDSSNYYLLDSLVMFMKTHPNLIVEIDTHSLFNQEDLRHSMSLTTVRAKGIVDTLIKMGVNSAKLVPKGWSYSKPLISQSVIDKMKTQKEKDAAYAINSRTDFRILSITYGSAYPDSGFTNKTKAKNLYKDSLKDGIWIEYVDISFINTNDTNAPYYKLIFYKAGKPYGNVHEYYKKGKLRIVTPYTNGVKNGTEKWYYESGQLETIVPYINDSMTGIVKTYYESGELRSERPCINFETVGVEKFYYKNGNLQSEYNWVKGKAEWTQKDYDTNGVFRDEATYIQGKCNGMYKYYYKTGVLQMELPYTDNKRNGLERMYYESGKLEYEITFNNDTVIGVRKEYYENGVLESETPFVNGQQNGIAKEYYESGKLKIERPIVNNRLNGVYKEYYESGKLKTITYIPNGIEGATINYDENGNEIKQ
jgi:antitoxin component YwqK of YwqJK toxin-antitoxin module